MNRNRDLIRKIKIWRADGQAVASSSTHVVREIALSIVINGKLYANIACAGNHLDDLAAGFLRSEKIISSRKNILKLDIDARYHRVNIRLKKKKTTSGTTVKNIASSGARGKILAQETQTSCLAADDTVIKTSVILTLMDHLLHNSKIHNRTGGTHCSALAMRGKIIALREDIGRHNTIDMLGGHALLKNIDLSNAIILTTGRISSEIVYKVWNMGIPVIVSHSAPTENAVVLSDQAGITLIGYVRGGKMNIYTHERRVMI
jgi:FdhD protein